MNPMLDIDPVDDMEEEYDFATMKHGIRGKYADAFKGATTAIVLDADVAQIFPDSEAVNQALRTLARVLSQRSVP